MGTGIQLRAANKNDLDSIQRILESCKLPIDDIPQKVDSLFVAYEGSELVGTGGVEMYGRVGLLRSIAILEYYRGRGYGKNLVDSVVEKAKAKGIKELFLLTTTAQNFFSKLGFEVVKRDSAPAAIRTTEEFKHICAVTSVLMRKKLQ
jgi:amino-acid N-acetyltransferase